MSGLYQKLKEFGKVKANEPMSKHTTFKVGGPADFFVIVNEVEKLVELLGYLDGEGVKYFVLGGGSNLLVSDDGFRGVVVKSKDLREGESRSERGSPGGLKIPSSPAGYAGQVQDSVVEVGAGVATVDVARKTVEEGLVGFEWGVGMPGTIGGAVRGNAGAMGGEMKDSVSKVEVYRDGEILELTNDECEFGYRDSVFKRNSDVILRVWLELEKGDSKEGMKKALEALKYRNATQPKGFASSGCIFRNIQITDSTDVQITDNLPDEFVEKGSVPAGWLIEVVGLKGRQVGRTQVSEKHGNFIVNLGGATATDILTLIEEIKEKVYNRFKINLEEEIKII